MKEAIEASFVVLLILLAIGIFVVFILLIVAVFKIQKNTRLTAANIVITNKKLVEIRKLLEQNLGEAKEQNTSALVASEMPDSEDGGSGR